MTEQEHVVIRIEPINTNALKSKFSLQGPEVSIDISQVQKKVDNSILCCQILQRNGYKICNLRLKIMEKNILKRIKQVYFDIGGEKYYFYEKEKPFEFSCQDATFLLPLHPFSKEKGEILVPQTYVTDYINVTFQDEEPLQKNQVFLEWSSCDVATEQIENFNQLSNFNVDECTLSSEIAALTLFTELQSNQILLCQRGLRGFAQKEDINRYGEILYDSQDDESDFLQYQKEVQVEGQIYFNISANANDIQTICFGAPHRIPYPRDNYMFLTTTPKMSILVSTEHAQQVQDYLNTKPCIYNTSRVTEWVPMNAEEKKERQKWLRENAEHKAAFYNFFSRI